MTPSRSSSSVRSLRAVAAAAAVLAGSGGAWRADAATVLERRVAVAPRPDGAVRETTALRVRLDSAADLAGWSAYPVYLDDHRTLVDATGVAVHPDGKRDKVRRRDRDTVQAAGDGILHQSARFHLLEFSGLRVGTVLEIDVVVDERPYFPAGEITLLGGERVERLEVDLSGFGAGWRWRLDGPADGLTATGVAGGVRVTGSGLAVPEGASYAPAGSAVQPVLRYAWDDGGSWEAVGRWFSGLVAALPRGGEEIARAAREATAGLGEGEGRAKLEALLAVAQKIRYTAVEVGIGGFRPHPPQETLARRWGDCKDKSLLLVDLLASAGLEAYPALVLSADDDRVDAAFPTPFAFNHAIVAVPAAAVGAAAPEDPVADGLLFVDPTQTRGPARYLQRGVHDQDALVVLPYGARLVRIPARPAHEVRRLTVNLNVGPDGDGRGGAGIEVEGGLAAGLLGLTASATPDQVEGAVREIFSAVLPAVSVGAAGWQDRSGDLPKVSMSAAVTLPGLVRGTGGRASFQLPGLKLTPEPGHLAGRTVPVVLAPGSLAVSWHLALPAGCRPAGEADSTTANAVGSFRQRVSLSENRRLVVERTAELTRRWFEPAEFPLLAELAQAEHRAHQRRIRLECGGEAPEKAGEAELGGESGDREKEAG